MEGFVQAISHDSGRRSRVQTHKMVGRMSGRPGGVGHLDLFMVGNDGAVQSAFFENSKWQSGWFAVTSHPETGKAVPGQPVTAVWRDNKSDHLDLFITGTDGIVKSTFFENGKWQPECELDPIRGTKGR